ncbi:hypothetical protein ABH926_000863 [Catenulispora sp. GP43]|uniref:hypothetical protein n=1 Tax=Catenulispora sp. GP43 TaxID=3156263 RepID=UPI00351477F5
MRSGIGVAEDVAGEAWLVRDAAGGLDAAATRQRHADFLAGVWLPGLGVGAGAQPEPLPARRIRVTFNGPGFGRAALTWGQRDIWATMTRQRNWLPQGGRRPLAPGSRVEDVAAELAYLHGRYQAMRTRLEVDEHGAWQDVAPAGETFLDVFDTPPGQDPDTLAARVEAVYRHRPCDLRTEWPVRMAVVRAGGVCTHLVVLMHHLALDAGGAAVMIREVAARETAEPAGMQPLEQAAWQASETGLRHSDRTLRYFGKALDRLAAGPPPVLSPRPQRPRHWSGRLVSPALASAVATVGARCVVDDSAVLTAVTAIAFARLTGTERVLMRPRVGNRFRPALAGVVCFAAQSGLLVLELGGTTFDQAVDRARGASLAAVKNAYFDPEALEALLGRFAANHGRGPEVAMFFNDRHGAEPGVEYANTAAPNPREPQRRRGGSVFAWLHRGPEPTEPLSVTVDDAEGALAVSLHFDTHVVAPEAIEELAWGIERAAVQAAADGDVPTGIRRTPDRRAP